MPGSILTPATLVLQDGIPFAESFGDVYHSADGGLEQARHVFLGGTRAAERWRSRERFSILETGFGLGLNFLATWQAWREDPLGSARLHYLAIEKHPFRKADLETLYARWPELAELSRELVRNWPSLTPGFHRIALDGERVVLTLVLGDIADCLAQVDPGAGFDAIYLDGFAPSKNPDMWAAGVMTRVGRTAARGATLATYTVASAVRTALTQAGFLCEKSPGFGRKRDMLTATYAPRWPVPTFATPERSAVVLGAGLAGCNISERLCARGWQVTLVERHQGPAQEISGNRAGIVLPMLSRDDNRASRAARTAYLYALRRWQALGGAGVAFDGEACGVLQLAANAEDAQVQRDAAALFPDAPEFVQWLDVRQVEAHYALRTGHGGWLFGQGGWATPGRFCEALLAACGSRLTQRFGQEVAHLRYEQGEWQVRDERAEIIAAAPHLVLANGNGAASLTQAAGLPFQRFRGQVTHVPADSVPTLPLVICGDAYMTRPAGGTVCIGATYDFDNEPSLRASSQQANLETMARMLPQLASTLLAGRPLDGRVGFRCATPDRLPMAGPLPDLDQRVAGSRLRDVARHPKLYGLLGYGSRGLIWSPFCAELLASMIEGEPLPIEHDLAGALDPARFVLREFRRTR